MSDNSYAPANLIIQLLFLIAGVWFARSILRTMRASQEQVRAILKLSITGVTAGQNSSTVSTYQPLAAESPYCLKTSETEAADLPQPRESGPGRFTIARRKVALWLQTPMSRSETAPWRRVINWLQAPAGS